MADDNPFSFNSFLSGKPPGVSDKKEGTEQKKKVGSVERRPELDSIFDDDSSDGDADDSFDDSPMPASAKVTATKVPVTKTTAATATAAPATTIPDAFTWSSSEDGEDGVPSRRGSRATRPSTRPAAAAAASTSRPVVVDDDGSELESSEDGVGSTAAPAAGGTGGGGCASCPAMRDRVRRAETRSLAAETEAAALAAGAAAARRDAKLAKERVAELEAREAADTQALVAMLEKIERNLVTMTSRAEAAEARADELARQLLARQEEGSARATQVFIDAADPGERLQAAQDAGSLAAARLAGALRASEKAMAILMEQAANVRGVAKTLDSLGRVSTDTTSATP